MCSLSYLSYMYYITHTSVASKDWDFLWLSPGDEGGSFFCFVILMKRQLFCILTIGSIKWEQRVRYFLIRLKMISRLSILLCVLVNVICLPSALGGNVCGGVSPYTSWSRTTRSDTIQMSIDTSTCRLEITPLYFTSVIGTAGHYLLVGVNAIYEPTESSFHIDVRSLDNATADIMMARSAEFLWNVTWVAYSS